MTEQDWEQLLPTALLAIRTSRNRMTGVTPHYALFGREARLPIDIVYGSPGDLIDAAENPETEELTDRMEKAYKYIREYADQTVERERGNYSGKLEKILLKEGDKVWLFTPRIIDPKGRATMPKKFLAFWSGPWEVTKVISPVLYTIQTCGEWNQGGERTIVTTVTVGVDRLKRYKANDRPGVTGGQPLPVIQEDLLLEDEFLEGQGGGAALGHDNLPDAADRIQEEMEIFPPQHFAAPGARRPPFGPPPGPGGGGQDDLPPGPLPGAGGPAGPAQAGAR